MNALEILSALLGVTGTLLLALKSRYAGWAFVAYLISNIGWIVFGASHAHWALLAQHAVFSVTSLIGIWTWLIRPHLCSHLRSADSANRASSSEDQSGLDERIAGTRP